MNMCSIISTESGALIAQFAFGDGGVSIGPLTNTLLLSETWALIPLASILLCMPASLPNIGEKTDIEHTESSEEIVTIAL
jgi:hypothetical protein